MPSVFLSPSTQESNEYITGGNEGYHMNLITDAMTPYLQASDIDFYRNNPNESLSKAIALSNAGNFDIHLAIHSNASPSNTPSIYQGPNVYYYTTSIASQRLSDIIVEQFKTIYPNPDLAITLPSSILAELRQTKAPAVLVEVGYHDNYNDALWIQNNTDNIGKILALSLAKYFKIPSVEAHTNLLG